MVFDIGRKTSNRLGVFIRKYPAEVCAFSNTRARYRQGKTEKLDMSKFNLIRDVISGTDELHMHVSVVLNICKQVRFLDATSGRQ